MWYRLPRVRRGWREGARSLRLAGAKQTRTARKVAMGYNTGAATKTFWPSE